MTVDGDVFVVDGKQFKRRRFAARAQLQPVIRRRDPIEWDSQVAGLPSAAALQDDVPSEGEFFTYLSSGMTADSSANRRGRGAVNPRLCSAPRSDRLWQNDDGQDLLLPREPTVYRIVLQR